MGKTSDVNVLLKHQKECSCPYCGNDNDVELTGRFNTYLLRVTKNADHLICRDESSCEARSRRREWKVIDGGASKLRAAPKG